MKNIVKNSIIYILLVLLLVGCSEDDTSNILEINLDEQQKAAVSLRGSWGIASDVQLPFGTTPGVLNDLLIEFRIDNDYQPHSFSASGADYFFNVSDGNWSWVEASTTEIVLSNVQPITQIEVIKEAVSIRLTFNYPGGKVNGAGEYGCTLTKIAP